MASQRKKSCSHERWNAIDWALLWVYQAPVPRVDVWSDFITVPAGVFFVLRGAGCIQTEGRTLDFGSGQALLAAPGLRRQRFEPGTELLSVGFRATERSGQALFVDGLNRVVPGDSLKELRRATERLLRVFHGRRRPVDYLTALLPRERSWSERCREEAAFREWLAELVEALDGLGIYPMEPRRPEDPRVAEVLRRLESWPLDRPLDRKALLAGVGVGWRRLQQLTRAEFGFTPAALVEKRRLAAARERLAQSPNSLKEIAFGLGFRHASHFTMWFRRLTGQTPTVFRQGV